jgi:pimeloyl-ACP methyl ester carboxylesterase
MVVPVPGEYDDKPAYEISIGFLNDLVAKSGKAVDHNYFRLAIPYLRGLDVLAAVLGERSLRAVIGGHSKRATSAYTAAAMDPERVAGVVYMGNESTFSNMEEGPLRALLPFHTQTQVRADVLYLGATNEDGYQMFAINQIQARMNGSWTIEYIPNYRHADQSEKHFLDWQMWVAHVFDGRPLARISDLAYEETAEGTLFRARIQSPNRIIQAKVWYVYCDDVPYWRDLVWYAEFMSPKDGALWEGYVTGTLPDAWLVEVKDIGGGFAGYLSSLPQAITHKPTARRTSRGSRSRLWEPKKPDLKR